MNKKETERFDLFCFGGSSVDLILNLPRLPLRGEKLVVSSSDQTSGGFIANAACAAGRLGLKTAWGGQLGDDDSGIAFLDEFNRFNVDVSNVRILQGYRTDICVVFVEPDGERTILVVPTTPAPPEFSPEQKQSLAKSDYGYTMPYTLDWFLEFSNIVRAGGGKVVIDLEENTSLSLDELLRSFRHTDIVFCNPGGLALLGKSDDSAAATEIINLGVSKVVLTRGKDGAELFTKNERHSAPGFKVPVRDTTGAGDVFHAAYLSALLKGLELHQSLEFANAAAAISVQHAGPRGGLPSFSEVEEFISNYPN